jgi:hypothetical protein
MPRSHLVDAKSRKLIGELLQALADLTLRISPGGSGRIARAPENERAPAAADVG